jgi:hypothetical protein
MKAMDTGLEVNRPFFRRLVKPTPPWRKTPETRFAATVRPADRLDSHGLSYHDQVVGARCNEPDLKRSI